MSLLDTAPAGAEANAAPAAQELNEQSAAAAFEGLLDWEENPGEASADNTESVADEAADTGPDESPTPEEDEGQSDPQDGKEPAPATIEPPQSMTAEEKAAFSKLPPEAQHFLARRDSEQRALLTQRTQEIADQRKAFDTERQAIDGQRKQYLESLQTMLQLAVPEAKQFAEITDAQWQALATQDPSRYVQLRAARDSLAERFGRVQAEMQRVSQEAAEAQKKRFGDHLAEQKAKLVEKIPEFGDQAKAMALSKEITDTLTGTYGFSPDEIGQAADHRLLVLARDAMLYRKAEAARAAAMAKKANPPPRVQQPNAAPERSDSRTKAFRDQLTRQARTGSVHDTAALFMHLLPQPCLGLSRDFTPWRSSPTPRPPFPARPASPACAKT